MSAIVARMVEVCVFRMVKDRPEYLLLRRAADEEVYPGLWQIVTGTIEEGETALHAALREMKEETGLVATHFWVAPFTGTFYDHRRDAVNLVPFFAAQVGGSDMPCLSTEHSVCVWLPLVQARNRLVWPGQRAGLSVVHESLVAGEEAASLSEIPLPR